MKPFFTVNLSLIFSCIFIFCEAQNVGIGTNTPVNRLDVASLNNWDLINTEGDARIGNNNFRLKFGVATGGGGAGAASIMQYGVNGGFNLLSLGSQGKYIIQLNGTSGRAGIGTDAPAAELEIKSTNAAIPKLMLTQPQSIFSPLRMRFSDANTSKFWDIVSVTGDNATAATLSFSNSNTGAASFGINGNAALLLNGNAGTAGQVLQSRGNAQSAQWASSTNQLYNGTNMLQASSGLNSTSEYQVIPGLLSSFSTAGPAKVLVSFNVTTQTIGCAFCAESSVYFRLLVNNTSVVFKTEVPNQETMSFSSSHLFTVGGGTHTIQLQGQTLGPTAVIGSCCFFPNSLIYQVIPQ